MAWNPADITPAAWHHGGPAVQGDGAAFPYPGAGAAGTTARTGFVPADGGPAPVRDGPAIRSGLPPEVTEAPATAAEAYRGSLRALLERNRGGETGAAFLLGERSIVSRTGELYAVGGDYLAIRQGRREAYFVSDLYALRYAEFPGVCGRGMEKGLAADGGM